MSGTDVAADVPGKFDVVIDGFGYVTARAVDPNMPFRVQQQQFSYSPTFVERSNISNSYGDQAQDFFMNIRQRDWSQGEQQKYFRAGQDGRYWMGLNVDVSVPGQVNLFPQTPSLSFAATVISGCKEGNKDSIVVGSATNLYRVNPVGTITDNGAHGLGAAPAVFGSTPDGFNMYLSTTAAGTVGVRKWNGTAFSTFSASAADSLAFLNNTLYGLRGSNEDLVRYDTAGTLTSLFSWKDAAGAAQGVSLRKIEPFGGKLLILLGYGQEAGGELWIYDGTGCFRLEVFPPNFFAYDIEVLYGVAYISGSFFRPATSTTDYTKPAILFFDGSQVGKLWEANAYSTGTVLSTSVFISASHPALGVYDGRLIFTDETTGNLMAYDPALGGVSSISSYTTGGDSPRVIVSGTHLVHIRDRTLGYYIPAATYPTSGYVISSLVDFDSSLSKVFRGVKVEFAFAADGDGGSVDIAYQLDSLSGVFTSLATGVTSGTEVLFPANTAGHSVSVKITLNKGTSTAGPTLKSYTVRGIPVLNSYHINTYILDLGGSLSASAGFTVKRRDGSDHNLNGEQMRVNLTAAIRSTTPVTVTDRSGTFTAILDPGGCEFDQTSPGEWYALIKVREV